MARARARRQSDGFAALPIWCVLAAVVVGGSVVADEMDVGGGARPGQGGVRPVAGEGLWSADDERSVDGGALAGVASDCVGEFDVVGKVVQVQPAMLAAVSPDLNGQARSVVSGDRAQGAVVDIQTAIVASSDDPVSDTPGAILNPEGRPRQFTALA
jgi:hypothetical protein